MLIAIARDGQEIGEWSEYLVRAYYHQGDLLATDLYWHEGMTEWKPLGELVKPPLPGVQTVERAIPATSPPPLPDPVPAPKKPARDWKTTSLGCLKFLFGVMAYIIGFGVAKTYILNDHELVMDIFYGAVGGFACGLIPLIIARRRGLPCQRHFLICGSAGAIGGLILAVPVCIGLTVYVCTKTPPREGKP